MVAVLKRFSRQLCFVLLVAIALESVAGEHPGAGGEKGKSGTLDEAASLAEEETTESRYRRPVGPPGHPSHHTPGPSRTIYPCPRGWPGPRGFPGESCKPDECRGLTEAQIETICERIVQKILSSSTETPSGAATGATPS